MEDVHNDIGWFWVSWKSAHWRPHLQRCMLACISFLRHKNRTNKIHYIYGETHNCWIYILRVSTHLCQFIEELLSGHCTGYTALHHVLWSETHHTYWFYTSLQTLYNFNFWHVWSALYFIPFYIIYDIMLQKIPTNNCNRNVTLKMSGLRAETCRWKCHNRKTSVELSVMCWSSANSQV
jgi:hypothetical protein